MKKYFTFLSFIALFFIGMQISSAQSNERQLTPEVLAKEKTLEMHQLLKLDGKQQNAIFDVLLIAEKNAFELRKDNISEERKQVGEDAISAMIAADFKKILSPKQFRVYEEFLLKSKK